MRYDLLLKNADIITLDPNNKRANWVAIDSGKIVDLGFGDNTPNAAEVFDLKGKVLLPGFCDSHVHGTLTGEALCAVDLGEARSVRDILEMLEEDKVKNPNKDTIVGYNYLEENLREKRHINVQDLDEVIPDRKVLIHHQSYHGCVLNSKGIAASGIDASMQGVETINGKMTGLVSDDVPYGIVLQKLMAEMNDELLSTYMKACSDAAVAKGITSIHMLNGSDYPDDMPGWIDLAHIIPIHTVDYWQTLDVDLVRSHKQRQVGGCICLDGSRILRTMAIFEPYSDDPKNIGELYYSEEEVYNFVSKAGEYDMQCAMHASGERAIEQYINILEKVSKEQGHKGLRNRIEHFSMPTERHIEMTVELELALPMQPIFSELWDTGEDSIYKQRFGKARAERIEPINEIVKAGGIICGGSDSPVTPLNPLAGISACVNNPNPIRNISVTDALKIFTVNGAWAAREEKERGTIEIGKYGDLVVLDKSPYDNEKNINSINVKATIINGKIEFGEI